MSRTLAEIAAQVGGELRGDGTIEVVGLAPLDEAEPHHISWVASRRFLPKLRITRAAAVLAPAEIETPSGLSVIVVDDPDLAAVAVLSYLGPSEPVIPSGVAPSAVVEADAQVDGACIGAGVYVGEGATVAAGAQLHPGVYVGPGARIGADCVLMPNVVVGARCELGARVRVHANATIGADGFGYLQRGGRHVKIPQVGVVIIEDDVEIGANTCIDRARSGVTRIGEGTKIDNLVQIAHNVSIGPHSVVVAQVGVSGSCRIGRGVILAGQSGVADHVTIGDRAIVMAQSGVLKDVEPGNVLLGSPATLARESHRQNLLTRRLPELVAQMKELAKRIEALESAAND